MPGLAISTLGLRGSLTDLMVPHLQLIGSDFLECCI